jgi:hypothetical protein
MPLPLSFATWQPSRHLFQQRAGHRPFYGAATFGIDLTTKMASYLADPGNSRQVVIGSDKFFRIFCGGRDPAPGTTKLFSVSLRKSGYIINQCGYDGETVDLTPPANQSWMTDLFYSISRQQMLSQICLPGTHDSGTYSLGSTFSTNPAGSFKAVIDTIKAISDKIDVIPLIDKFIDPLDWIKNAVLDNTRALATSTHSDIAQQLNDGIRRLDLRVYFNHDDPGNPFYTYHGLAGSPNAPDDGQILSGSSTGASITRITFEWYAAPPGPTMLS